jgi:Phage integrase family
MTVVTGKRRGRGEDSIYWDEAKSRYVGAVSLGYSASGARVRKKVMGRTKTEVRDKLRELHSQAESGVRPRRHYTINDALDDWLENGAGRACAVDREALPEHDGCGASSRARRGQADSTDRGDGAEGAGFHGVGTVDEDGADRAQRAGAGNPACGAGRPSGAECRGTGEAAEGAAGRAAVEVADAGAGGGVDGAARGTRLEAYVVLSLLSGLRTEEARALRWDHVVAWVGGQWVPVAETGFDHGQVAVFVWRAERAGGDTKTPESRRTLALPRKCVEALREHRVRQVQDRLVTGPLWQDHGLVFASAAGTPMDDGNVRRMFRAITEDAGLGTGWVPREMRHTFVSLLSARGVPVEAIALLAGHNQTSTTELVYRHQIVPALTRGAEVMDQIFG